MLNYKKSLVWGLLLVFAFGLLLPVPVVHAGTIDGETKSPQASANNGFIGRLFHLLFDGLLGAVLGVFSSDKSPAESGKVVKALPDKAASGKNIRGKVIVVDPGHGGSNPGAVHYGINEADVNLAIAKKLQDKLTKAGATVVMTRETDREVATKNSSLGQELQARVDIATQHKADAFISVHANSNANSNIQGAMTFYPQNRSSQLAQFVQTSLLKETQANDKGVEAATFYVLRKSTMPSILVETGFLSNKAEGQRLNAAAYQAQVAEGIFQGILNYFNQ